LPPSRYETYNFQHIIFILSEQRVTIIIIIITESIIKNRRVFPFQNSLLFLSRIPRSQKIDATSPDQVPVPRSNRCILMSRSSLPGSRSFKNLERTSTLHYEGFHVFFRVAKVDKRRVSLANCKISVGGGFAKKALTRHANVPSENHGNYN